MEKRHPIKISEQVKEELTKMAEFIRKRMVDNHKTNADHFPAKLGIKGSVPRGGIRISLCKYE